MSFFNWFITWASHTFTLNPVLGFLSDAKKTNSIVSITLILYKINSCKYYFIWLVKLNRLVKIKILCFFACLELNGFGTFSRFVTSLFIMFSCFLRVSEVVSLCFEEVRRCLLSKHFIVLLISGCFLQICS